MSNVPFPSIIFLLACLFPNHDNIIITVPISITVTIGNGSSSSGKQNMRRCCFLCSSPKSSANSKGHNIWYRYRNSNDFHICATCYQMERRVPTRKDGLMKSPRQIKFCMRCGTYESRKNKMGYNTWRYHNGGRLCYNCNLDLEWEERNNIRDPDNGKIMAAAGCCQSLICVQQRAKTPHKLDYSKFNYCSVCITQFPLYMHKCKCCNYKLRNRRNRRRDREQNIKRY